MNEKVQRLNEIREAKKMSQEAIAREIGVSLQTVNRWLKGKTSPGIHVEHLIDRFIKNNG